LVPEADKETPEMEGLPELTPEGVTVTVQEEDVPMRAAETVQVGAMGPTGGELQVVLPPGPVIVAEKVVVELASQVALVLVQLVPEADKVTPGMEGLPELTPEGITVTVQEEEVPVRAATTVQVGAAIAPTGAELQVVVPPGPVIVAVKVVEAF
jgi:hypothetical protein